MGASRKGPARRALRIVLAVLAALVAAVFAFVLAQQPPRNTYIPEAQARRLAQAALADPVQSAGAGFWETARLGDAVPLYDLREQPCEYVYFVEQDGRRVGSVEVWAGAADARARVRGEREPGAIDVLAQRAIGRRVRPGDHLYSAAFAPYRFAMRGGDGTCFVMQGENTRPQQIPAWEFWLACKARLAAEPVRAEPAARPVLARVQSAAGGTGRFGAVRGPQPSPFSQARVS